MISITCFDQYRYSHYLVWLINHAINAINDEVWKHALFAKLNAFNYRLNTFTSFVLNWLTTPEMFVWTVMMKLRDFRLDS